MEQKKGYLPMMGGRRGGMANEEGAKRRYGQWGGAEEEVLAYEEYITAWLDKEAKRRYWPMRRGNLQGDALAPAARPRVRRQRARMHLKACEGRACVHLKRARAEDCVVPTIVGTRVSGGQLWVYTVSAQGVRPRVRTLRWCPGLSVSVHRGVRPRVR